MCKSPIGEPSTQTPAHLLNLIKEIAEKEGFDKYETSIKPALSDGANLTSNLFVIKLTEDGKNDLDMFAKVSNTPLDIRMMAYTQEVFKREIFALTRLSSIFENLQQRHNIPENERFAFPKFYSSRSVELEETVVLENMKNTGYIVYDRFKSMDWEYASAAIRELSKFHALSYALNLKDPETFADIVKSKRELYHQSSHIKKYLEKNVAAALKVLDGQYKERFLKFVEKIYEATYSKQLLQPTARSVLIHGDYRLSNILAKYDKDVIVSLIPIDYQTIYYGSPLNDLLYFIFTGSDQTFRRNHYNDSIKFYYNSLTDSLEKLGMKINEIYPEEEFYADVKARLHSGLYYMLFLLPLLSVGKGESTSGAAVKDHNTMFKVRLNELIEDFVSYGVL